jgi:hypothetical protein
MKKYKYNRSFEAMRTNIEDTSYGVCPAPMDAQLALNILTDYLLGEDWYVAISGSAEQINACAVEQILDKCSKQWKKDWKTYKKDAEKPVKILGPYRII